MTYSGPLCTLYNNELYRNSNNANWRQNYLIWFFSRVFLVSLDLRVWMEVVVFPVALDKEEREACQVPLDQVWVWRTQIVELRLVTENVMALVSLLSRHNISPHLFCNGSSEKLIMSHPSLRESLENRDLLVPLVSVDLLAQWDPLVWPEVLVKLAVM